jgi:hypothetical protein
MFTGERYRLIPVSMQVPGIGPGLAYPVADTRHRRIWVDLEFLNGCFEKFDFDAWQRTFTSVGFALQLPSCSAQRNSHLWPFSNGAASFFETAYFCIAKALARNYPVRQMVDRFVIKLRPRSHWSRRTPSGNTGAFLQMFIEPIRY